MIGEEWFFSFGYVLASYLGLFISPRSIRVSSRGVPYSGFHVHVSVKMKLVLYFFATRLAYKTRATFLFNQK